jgi:demethylmenaquinone methyltransferase / 2-methoxy-6-polyprenyl-1,4-benzoquinol methylase
MKSLPVQAVQIQNMFGRVAKRYDLLNGVLSAGNDLYWRWQLTRAVRRQLPARLLDLATGSGDVLRALRRGKAIGQRGIGADFCLPMLQVAREKGIGPLCAADGLKLPFADGSFDAVTISFGLRNLVDRKAGLREMHRVLAPGGRLYVLEFSHPVQPFTSPYFWYLRHILPGIAGLFGTDRGAYDYLGESIEAFPRQKELAALMEEAGFKQVTYTNLTFGIAALHSGNCEKAQKC